MSETGPILVYQIGSLGDTIVSIPCYRALRRHFKGREIRLLQAKLAEGRVMPSDMLVRENLIDGVFSYPQGRGLKEKFDVWKTVVKARPSTVAYIGPGERPPKLVDRDKSFFRLCGVKNLVGFHGVDYASLQNRDTDGNLQALPHQARLRMDRLAQDGIEARESDFSVPLLHPTSDEREQALEWLEKKRTRPARKLLLMGVSTAQPATRWPIERFQETGARIVESGLAEIVIVGGPAEKAIGQSLVDSWGEGCVAAGEFGVHEMAALMSHADLYLGLDTGTTHMAAAVGIPIVTLYSDHNQPGEWDPLGQGHTVLMHRVPCQGCRLTECPVEGHPCMTGITVDQVWQAVEPRLK